ncbi:MAG: hypothetical protein B7Z55_04530, partial [Planctomycetales bacterium 12-60-4]
MEILAALSLEGLSSNVIGILGAMLGLGLVIFLHELGHFAVAKWCNVYVERFSIGFGPILLGWKWGETEYALSAIPFGGYVKMLGQDDADPSQMTSEEIAADPRSYVSKNVWQRMAIISAGVTMNVLTAILFYALAFGLGSESQPPVIGEVRPGKPAWQAGIGRGDTITEFNGREVTNFRDLALNVAVSTGEIELKGIHRDGTPFDTRIEPDTKGTRPQIGIYPSASLKLADVGHGVDSPVVAGTVAAKAEPPFKFGDEIVKVGGEETKSFAQFQDQLAARGAEPTTITVARRTATKDPEKFETEYVDITVGVESFRTLGLKLDAGLIASIQKGSPADKAGLQVGDKLAKINGRSIGLDIDPMQLPNEFASLHGQDVELVYIRQNPTGGREEITVTLVPRNRPGWLEQLEVEGEPIAIPAIGIAMHIFPFVLQVVPDSPAAVAGIQPNSAIQKVVLTLPDGAKADGVKDKVLSIPLSDESDPKKANNWAFAFWMIQRLPEREVQLTLKEKDSAEPKTVKVTPQPDPAWPSPAVGLRMQNLFHEEKADSVPQAFSMAVNYSRNTVLNIYMTLRSLVTQRLSYKELHGPLGIAQAAFVSAKTGLVP